MKLQTKLVLIFVFLLIISSPVFDKNNLLIKDIIKKELDQRIKNGKTVGAVIGVIHPDGKREYHFSGLTNSLKKTPILKESLFEIGSITKTFTALLFAQMILGKKFDLNAPAEKYLPNGVTLPVYKGKKILLRHLSSHLSGLPRMPNNFRPKNPLNPYADYPVEKMYKCLKNISLITEPGSTYAYSNLGAGLLGNILEIQSKKSYEELIKEKVCEPLGMNHTTITLTGNLKNLMSSGHNMRGPTPLWDLTGLAGAGAIRSNVDDMLTYLGANLGVIKTKLSKAMNLTHEIRKKVGQQGPYNISIGFGWHVLNFKSSTIYAHNGGTGGFRTFIGFRKDTLTGVVLLSNKNISLDDIALHILDPNLPLKQ